MSVSTALGSGPGTRPGRGHLRVAVLIFAVLSMLFTLPGAAQYGDGSGGGGGGGGGGGHPTDNTGSVYSDLLIVLRAANGTPILKKFDVPADEDSDATTAYCVQPISYEPVPGLIAEENPVDGRDVYVLPLQGEWITAPPPGPLPVVEIEPCDPQPQYAMFAAEVELERLNLARTDDAVLAQKLADVAQKLFLAEEISLQSTGRLLVDDKAIDASPENAAMYQSLMKTGTIPGLPETATTTAGPPAEVGPLPADATSNSRFGAWELAAMTIGAAAGKSVPLTLDAVEYYNRAIGFPPPADPDALPPVPEYVSPWLVDGGPEFVRSEDPDNLGTELADSERFVDYGDFTYNRSETFKGSVTWLDITTLQWKVTKIMDVVPFTNLTSYTDEELNGSEALAGQTLTGLTAFAQLADDVRALCNFIPDNTFIPGFYMDVPGVDTSAEQLAAITDPAVDLGTLPTEVFQTLGFQVTMSLLNPWGGYDVNGVFWPADTIGDALLRITIDADEALAEGDISATSVATETAPTTYPVPFTLVDGNLVGLWGDPTTGFTVPPGYNVSTTFDVMVAGGAPIGDYGITLELVTVSEPDTVLAAESGSITVHDDVLTVLWGSPLPELATQGGSFALPVVVYAPAAQVDPAVLTLAITGPDDPDTTDVVEAVAEGDVTVYGSTGTDMAAMPLTLDETTGRLVGTWEAAIDPGLNPVTWYVTIRDGALAGKYYFDVELEGGIALSTHEVTVAAPDVHGEEPGEFTITVTPVALGPTATFLLAAEGDTAGVTFWCQLQMDGIVIVPDGEEDWELCQSPVTYTGLQPGSYTFAAEGRRGEVIASADPINWIVSATGPIDPPPPGGGGDTGGSGGGGGGGNAVMTPLAGDDRVETAVAVSQAQFPAKASAAVLANAGVFADALAGTPLAVAEDAPMLLTDTSALDSRVASELVRVLEPGATVYLLGGTAALSESVESALSQMGFQPVRFAGADRYETSVKIAEGLGNPTTVFLTTGHSFADGLAAGTAAATVDGAVLLTDGDAMAASVAAHLAAHPAQTRYAVGGPGTRADTGAVAIAGADRFATAAMVAEAFFSAPAFVGIANGERFPDALTGGVASAMNGGPLMLSASSALSPATAGFLTDHAVTIEEVQFYGGMAALSQAVRDTVANSLS